MLDEQHRDSARAYRLDQLSERGRLRGIHAGGGLVEREQLRLGGEGARNLEAPLVPVREAARGIVGARPDADVLEKLESAAFDLALFFQRFPVFQDRAEHSGTRARVPPDHDVFERGEVGEQADVLEGARDAGDGYPIGREAGDIAPVEEEAACVGPVDSGEEIEQRRLARAVRADQAVDFALSYGERSVLEGAQSTEPF